MNEEKDYIIYQGTAGLVDDGLTWTVRKYNSGVCEVFGYYTFKPTQWDAWGTAYESQKIGPFAFPPQAKFKDIPAFFSSACGIQSSVGVDNSTPVSTTQTPAMYVVRPNSGYDTNFQVSMYAIGYWK